MGARQLPDADSWQRCQTKRGLGIHPQPVRIVLLVILVASVLLLSACGAETETAQGKIKGLSPALRSGMMQMYIVVELNDSTEVGAWLPEDQAIWDKVSMNQRVEIQREGAEKDWEFVRFLDD
jgi:hypothetical protein